MRHLSSTHVRIRFGVFEADLRSGELRKAGVTIALQDQPFKVLRILLEHPGELVSREEIKTKIWPEESFGDFDHAVNVAVGKLRNALGDSAEDPRLIETLPRRGYRFIARIESVEPSRTQPVESSAPVAPAPITRRGPLPIPEPVKKVVNTNPRVIVVIVGLAVTVTAGFWLRSRRDTSTPLLPPLKVIPFTTYASSSAPAFSPDGNQIAFLWDGGKGGDSDIYVKLVGPGAPLRLTSSPGPKGGPAWSPDGRLVAFIRRGENEGIFTVSPLGGPERKVAPLNLPMTEFQELGRQADWSPDGKLLAVPDNPPGGQPGIFLVSLQNGEKRRLTSMATPGEDVLPTFSPNGKMVAFVRGTLPILQDIFVVATAGGKPKQLTFVRSFIGGPFSWTPDGKEIVFSFVGEESLFGLWRVSANGGAPNRLPVGGADDALEPVISHQGNRLAYTQMSTNVNIWQLKLPRSKLQMGAPFKLISSTRWQAAPQFSPDGKRIVFASNRSGSAEIWVCDSDGGNPYQLTSMGAADTGAPRWSPDGRQIAFDSSASGSIGVYVISVQGEGPHPLLVDSHLNAVPSWSRDGRWIYFFSDRGGSRQIWKVNPQGGQPVQVTKHGGFVALESPDGKFLYFTDRPESSGIWKTSPDGGEETLVFGQAINEFYWAPGKDGIYFIDTDTKPRAVLKFYSLATRQITLVTTLEKSPWSGDPALAVSPDGRSILYDQEDNVSSDIFLVENFR